MIERITTSVDLYPTLRVEVSVQGRGRERSREVKALNGEARTALPSPDERIQRDPLPRRVRDTDEREDRLVRFEQSAVAEDFGPEQNDSALEALPALTASVVPSDPRLAQAALVYLRSGRSRPATIGTRLNAVA